MPCQPDTAACTWRVDVSPEHVKYETPDLLGTNWACLVELRSAWITSLSDKAWGDVGTVALLSASFLPALPAAVAFMAAVLLATAAYAETECPGYSKKSDNKTIDLWTYSAVGYYTSWPETLSPEDITKNLTELWDKVKGDLKTISITP